MRHAVLIAGGAGERLWPVSRRARPKQLLRLFGGKSLLRLVLERLEGLFAVEQTRIVTSAELVDAVADEAPEIPRENLVGEPLGRNTANAIGLAAYQIARDDPDGVMAVFSADHLIQPLDRFQQTMRRAIAAAESHRDALVTLGVRPTEPHTGYGYIHVGAPVSEHVFRVEAFHEKPSAEQARAYLASGLRWWNAGVFVWRVAAIVAELERLLPENARVLARLAADWPTLQPPQVRDAYAALRSISIDHGVMEHARQALVTPLDCEWRDVGSWDALAGALGARPPENACFGGAALVLEGRNNVLIGQEGRLLVAVGLDDLVVVQSEDVTLVCRRQDAAGMRATVAAVRERFGERYL